MSELIVVRGPGKGSTVALSADRSVTIGSSLDAGLRVSGEGVAEEHVVVKALKGGGFGARGLGGGFEHNGRATEAARLEDGDVLRIGDSEIRYAAATDAESPPTDGKSSPTQLGGFALLGVLGKGGMGVVWRAEQKSLGREVALKVLSEQLTADPHFVGRFQAEARAAARLHHPNVVQVFDVDHDGDTWFYSMELMHGGSLETRLRREGKLPIDDAVRAIRDAANGLAFAEQVRIVHRDIKPDNLMVDRHGNVKLADLGLAQADDDGDEQKLRGTPHFMSPEQVQRKPLDHRSDLYSLGCTFYRLVTGRTPFQKDSVKEILRAHLNEPAPAANKVEAAVPTEIANVIARLLEKDPANRYQSAVELIEDLDAAVAPPPRRGLWVAIGALVLASVGVAIWFATKEPERIIEQVGDPEAEARLAKEAQRARAEKTQVEAENARLRVKASGLRGLELAEALDKVALDFPETKAALSATAEAKAVREETARDAERAALRAKAVATATAELESAVRERLEQNDVPGAFAAAGKPPGDASLAAAEELASVRTALRERVKTAAADAIAKQRASIATALETRDAEAADRDLGGLEAILRGEQAWPVELFRDRTELETWIGARRKQHTELAEAMVAESQAKARAALREGLTAPDGPLAAIESLDFALARTRLEALATTIESPVLAVSLHALLPSLGVAATYIEAARAGNISLPSPEAVLNEPLEALPVIEGQPANPRLAAVAWIELAHHIREARRALAAIRPPDDDSGVGDAGYRRGSALTICLTLLQGTQDEALVHLVTELKAADRIARALNAFAGRRNQVAAALLESVLSESPRTLVILAQR
ncbi:MAG: protein kinase [Planctomycetota bacterium]